MKKQIVKLTGGVHKGQAFPHHLQIAYGRYVFRLHHTDAIGKGVYLRDLPGHLGDLAREYGHIVPLMEYRSECALRGIPRARQLFKGINLEEPRARLEKGNYKTERVADFKNHLDRRVRVFLLHKGNRTVAQLELVEENAPKLLAIPGMGEIAEAWRDGILNALDKEEE